MNHQQTQLGGLECQIVEDIPEGETPSLIVIFCHGYGAPGTDLVGLGPELLSMNPELRGKVRFIFPAAPLSLDELGMYGGRAWWHIDLNRFQSALQTGDTRVLRNDTPEELPVARGMLMSLIDEVRDETGLPIGKILLGGFSQGSMLATDVALRLPEPPAGLCVFSGTLLCEDEWRELAGKRGPLDVIQSHGHQDPILPFPASEWLRDLLTEAGMTVDFIPFNGMHTIPYEALERAGGMISRLVSE